MKQISLLFFASLSMFIVSCKKNTTITASAFNPDFPDGTDNIIPVHLNIHPGSSYTVPAGKNFHGYIETRNFSTAPIQVNGQSMEGYTWNRIILTEGDKISVTADSLFVDGYITERTMQRVYVDIAASSYTVPANSQLYLTWLNVTPWQGGLELIYVNGVSINWSWLVYERSTSAYLVVDAGSTITTNAISPKKVFVNGFIRPL